MKKLIIYIITICLITFFGLSYYYYKTHHNDIIIDNSTNNLVITNTNTVIKENMNAIFFGDSITYGHLTNGYSWANYINDNYDYTFCINAGISDYRVSNYNDPNKWLATEVENHYIDTTNYNYVIMQGGINDLFYYTPIGYLSEDKNLDNFNSRTFIGGLETYLYKVTSKWPKAKIGYIITYYTPKYTERYRSWDIEDYKEYYDATKLVLDKWKIKYLDLSSDMFTDLLKVEDTTYLPDNLHLNDKGYKLISPYIYDWMKSL